jgi:hypothetical protein
MNLVKEEIFSPLHDHHHFMADDNEAEKDLVKGRAGI